MSKLKTAGGWGHWRRWVGSLANTQSRLLVLSSSDHEKLKKSGNTIVKEREREKKRFRI